MISSDFKRHVAVFLGKVMSSANVYHASFLQHVFPLGCFLGSVGCLLSYFIGPCVVEATSTWNCWAGVWTIVPHLFLVQLTFSIWNCRRMHDKLFSVRSWHEWVTPSLHLVYHAILAENSIFCPQTNKRFWRQGIWGNDAFKSVIFFYNLIFQTDGGQTSSAKNDAA